MLASHLTSEERQRGDEWRPQPTRGPACRRAPFSSNPTTKVRFSCPSQIWRPQWMGARPLPPGAA
jgi:hypothetical protein